MARGTATRSSALITGTASGIGAELARRFVARGYHVIAVDRTQELAERTAADLGAAVTAVGCDLSDLQSTRVLCDRITGDWSDELDVLVCNAGVVIPGDVADLSVEDLDVHLDVLLRSPVQLIRAALDVFRGRDSGHIMATVSMGAICPLPASAAYSAAKAGLRAFLAALNSELSNTDIAVSGIYPTAVDTPMLQHEARSGGSALNFLSAVKTVNDVADAYERALDKPKLEMYVPYHESLSARAALWTPALIPRIIPFFNRIGERGRKKYLAQLDP